MSKKPKGGRSGGASRITDSRFASFETDPRFKLPSTKKTKTTIDKRFARMLEGGEFVSAAKIDRYGRKIKSKGASKALKSLYRQEGEGEEDSELGKKEKKIEHTEADDDKAEDDIEDEEDEEEEVIDDDVAVEEELKAARAYDPARDGGFSSSESDGSDTKDEEDDPDVGASMQRFTDEQAQVEEGEVTRRIAVVNMDWDYIKSADLFALFSSFLSTSGGKVDKVTIYPSEFGKERMQREELEGPPREIFRKGKRRGAKDNSEDEDDSEVDDDSDAEDEKIKNELLQEEDAADFDSDALRSYQLDRLRYYYAVVVCSDAQTAKTLYDATDGTEYLTSSNFIDLRFVPDDVSFEDDVPRDECTSAPDDYEPIDFVTNALQSSKVKLTWDMHPEEANRKQSMRKAFGAGSRAEIQENDLKAYLASDTEDEDEAHAREEARRRMRDALGLGGDEEEGAEGGADGGGKKKDGPVGDMEITFTSALLDEPKGEREETTIEAYARKEKERKQKRRERAVANREAEEGVKPKKDGDAGEEGEGEKEDMGFDDPFFMEEEQPEVSKSQLRKEERRKKREAKEAEAAEAAAQKETLQKIMDEGAAEDGTGKFKHFDMKEITRAEKDKKKKKKKKKRAKKDGDAAAADESGGGDPAVLDDRFKSIFESHEYAVDTSNPQFTKTETMQKMLAEGRKRKNADAGGGDAEEGGRRERKKKRRESGGGGEEVDLGGLVASVKQKARSKGRK